MKDSLIIKFLYRTVLGRTLLKFLVHPKVSRVAAGFFSSFSSSWLVPFFVRKNKIDLSYYEVPEGGFASFNDFFTRKMKEKYITRGKGKLVSPCDGLLTISEIDENSTFYIKHTEYSLQEFLGNKRIAREFCGGSALIFRLTPAHYHRYLFCTTGKVLGRKRISGKLHSVQPICHEKTKVFVQNTREFVMMENEDLEKVVQMEIGALLVGKITNLPLPADRKVVCGEDKGYFEYGGSSIVVLTKKHVTLAPEVRDRNMIGSEIPVMVGETLLEE